MMLHPQQQDSYIKNLAYAYDVVLSTTRVVADHDVASATTRQLHQKLSLCLRSSFIDHSRGHQKLLGGESDELRYSTISANR